MSEPTAEFIRQILDYDPLTGIFRWRGGYARSVREETEEEANAAYAAAAAEHFGEFARAA